MPEREFELLQTDSKIFALNYYIIPPFLMRKFWIQGSNNNNKKKTGQNT